MICAISTILENYQICILRLKLYPIKICIVIFDNWKGKRPFRR
jgi:hypothetical protein